MSKLLLTNEYIKSKKMSTLKNKIVNSESAEDIAQREYIEKETARRSILDTVKYDLDFSPGTVFYFHKVRRFFNMVYITGWDKNKVLVKGDRVVCKQQCFEILNIKHRDHKGSFGTAVYKKVIKKEIGHPDKTVWVREFKNDNKEKNQGTMFRILAKLIGSVAPIQVPDKK